MPTRVHKHITATATGAVAVLLFSGLAAAPASAQTPDSVTENGGATRNDSDMTQALRDSIVDGPAKNVILLIGDGMGDSEITVARNYAEGAGGRFTGIDALPLTGQYTTYAVNADGSVNYASESASTATAWTTGTKTVNGRLGVDVNNDPQATILEIAKANGLKTGNVSTAEIQDATPGAAVSHVPSRRCYGPEQTTASCPETALENGGLGSISEQLLNVRPDVTLGGGAASFAQVAKAGPWQDKTLLEQASERGYQLVTDADGLAGVTAADASQPLLGLFAAGNFPVRWNGLQAVARGGSAAPVPCTDNPQRLSTGLSLASLTEKAISLLDNDKGFFLQVEGASIDKQNHAANPCGQIGETVDLDEAVQVALEFAKTNKDTLVVVTADHAHTSQIVGSTPPGLSASLLTAEGQKMIVAYGTADAGRSQQHTGAQVRIAGYGPGAANVVGLTDQTDPFFTAANSLSLNRDLPALSAGATVSVPAQVAPGAPISAVVSGLGADWQASAVLASDPVDLGQLDVLSGSATFETTAPTELGEHSITVTGSQTGTTVVARFTVAENPVTPEPGPDPEPTGAAGAGGVTPGGGPLALTGAAAPVAALLLAVLTVVAGALLARHRRRSFVS